MQMRLPFKKYNLVNKKMQPYFDKLVCKSDTCTAGTCRTYAYSLAFLAKHVDLEDLDGPEGVLAFLKE